MYEEAIDITTSDVTIANTVTETALYTGTLPGGSLNVANKAKWEMSGKISFAGVATLTLRLYYNNTLVTTCSVTSAGAETSIGIVIYATLNGDGSIGSQFGTIQAFTDADVTSNVGWGASTQGSGGDLEFKVTAQWSGASSSNTITNHHSVLSVLGIATVAEAEELDEDATAIIFVDSKLNGLDYDLRNDCYFYAPLEHDLIFYGYGNVTFTRATASTATWRDGGSHDVAINEPRFEYSGETLLGLAINTATETLTYDTDNDLSGSGTLCWLQDNVFKSTPSTTNPFNGSGVYTGTSGVHISNICKFNRVLTAGEIGLVQAALT